MVRAEMGKWEQTPEDLRRASLHAPHARTRERFQPLYLIASGAYNATACAAHIGRHDETVLAWVHDYNEHGPDAMSYRRTGGRAPLYVRRTQGDSVPDRGFPLSDKSQSPRSGTQSLFPPPRDQQLGDVVETTDPSSHGLPGHNWT